MVQIVIIYHSGYGHTAKVAEAVGEGARRHAGAHVQVLSVDALDEAGWAALDAADGIIFGSPTYMGGVSAKFKAFMESASKRWYAQSWKDKVAAGFTNSGAYSGDNFNTLMQLLANAMQHSMIWVGTGMKQPTAKGHGPAPDALNRLGSFVGVATQSNDDSPEVTPPSGDLETARMLGQRVAELAARLAGR
ncbi:MAG: flavodoxin family protein [Alphaproteobacteria bacterium]|nr:flavodoxin family protein [Alphaproteobacteria bacterium]